MKSLVALILVASSLPSVAMAQVNPSPQDAIIWFYRPSDSPEPRGIPTVHELGGLTRQLARLAPGEFFGYVVPPGTHTFSYTRAPSRGESLPIQVKAAGQAYVEVQFRELNIVSADLGRATVLKLRPIPGSAVLDRNVRTSLGTSSAPIVAPAPQITATTTLVAGPAIAPAPVVVELPATAAGSAIIALPTNVTPPRPATQVVAQPAKATSAPGITAPTKSADQFTGSAPLVVPAPPGVAAATRPVIASTSNLPPVVAHTPKPSDSTTPGALGGATSRQPSAPSTVLPVLSTPPVAPTLPKVSGPSSSPVPPMPLAASTTTAAPVRVDRNSASATSTPTVQPNLVPRKDPSSVPRTNQTRPPWPEQPASFTEVFSNARLNTGTGDKKQELEATVAFDKTGFWLLDPQGTTLKAFPYDNIRTVEYSSSKSPRWKNVGSGAPVATSASGSRYWLMVQTQSDYALLSLDKDNFRSVVGAFEMRSGKTVEIAAERR